MFTARSGWCDHIYFRINCLNGRGRPLHDGGRALFFTHDFACFFRCPTFGVYPPGSPVRVAHLSLDGNRARNTNTSALVIRSWMTVVEDILVSNAPVDGIRVSNVASDGKTMLTTSQVGVGKR